MGKSVTVRAPIRIDLAGGTVDQWPLYLLIDDARTINIGIDVHSETTIKETNEESVVLESLDLDTRETLLWDDFDTYSAPGPLKIPYRLIKPLKEKLRSQAKGFHITTRAKSPAGAGLGGSSALTISCASAIESMANGKAVVAEQDGEKIIKTCSDVEAQIQGSPTGLQDYYGAMFGGLQSLRWSVGQHVRKNLGNELAQEVSNRTLMFFSGKSRNSGINNWLVYKQFIEKDAATLERFNSIAHATVSLETALDSKDWKGVVSSIQDEWKTRRELAESISTEEMEKAHAEASKIHNVAFKVCGAGGGGCFFVMTSDHDPELLARIEKAVTQVGPQKIEFNVSQTGIQVEQSL